MHVARGLFSRVGVVERTHHSWGSLDRGVKAALAQ